MGALVSLLFLIAVLVIAFHSPVEVAGLSAHIEPLAAEQRAAVLAIVDAVE